MARHIIHVNTLNLSELEHLIAKYYMTLKASLKASTLVKKVGETQVDLAPPGSPQIIEMCEQNPITYLIFVKGHPPNQFPVISSHPDLLEPVQGPSERAIVKSTAPVTRHQLEGNFGGMKHHLPHKRQ